ncbi:MAG: peptidoglycan bridge formation glycyltransferase FemA/FemB family protein [Patescibacteria group bacterium]
MAEVITKEIDNKKDWEDFLSKHDEANFLQSWYWGEFHKRLGQKIIRSGFYQNNQLEGVMLSIIEEARRARHLIVPAGPIINWKDKDIVSAFVKELKKIAYLNDCAFVRVRPQIISDDFSKKLFKDLGFSDAPMHLHAQLTSQLDITKPEEEILANMRKNTRHEIRKAEKEKIKITTSKDPKDIRKFYNLQVETSVRQKFVPFPYEYLSEQFRIFAENNLAFLYNAYLGKKLLSQAFIIFYGTEAVYHYGTGTLEGRNHPGAYLIQWEVIREAKKRGLRRYNLWGVASNPKHRFYGLSIFKRGFGGEDVEYLPAQDLVINYPKYLINLTIEKLRKLRRRV